MSSEEQVLSDKKLKKAKKYRKAHKGGLAWAPIRRLMDQVGANIVARDAVDYLKRLLEEEIVDLTQRAMKFTELAKRKKVQADDIEMAIKMKPKKIGQ